MAFYDISRDGGPTRFALWSPILVWSLGFLVLDWVGALGLSNGPLDLPMTPLGLNGWSAKIGRVSLCFMVFEENESYFLSGGWKSRFHPVICKAAVQGFRPSKLICLPGTQISRQEIKKTFLNWAINRVFLFVAAMMVIPARRP